MKISICGSMHHREQMTDATRKLAALGHIVYTPKMDEPTDYSTLSPNERADIKEGLIRRHLEHIKMSDALLIINEEKNGIENYIGGNTLMEMAFGFALGLPIFLLNPIPDVNYKDELAGMKPVILNGDVTAVTTS